ncbi:hypothetical protein DRN94_000050 [archaeon]|nr:hypothetical protein [archaeon]
MPKDLWKVCDLTESISIILEHLANNENNVSLTKRALNLRQYIYQLVDGDTHAAFAALQHVHEITRIAAFKIFVSNGTNTKLWERLLRECEQLYMELLS